MAVPAQTFTTIAAVGNREDLSDEIYRIDPDDTPFLTSIERETADATNHEWQLQTLAPVATNAQAEGDDATADAAIPTVRRGNIAQISRKVPRVSGTQRAVEHAGRGDELAYQVMLKGKELKRDMENQLVGRNVAKSATDPRVCASVLSWIKTNTNKATTGTVGVDPTAADGTGTRTDGTQRAFTEVQLKDVLSKIWTAGGEPDTIMMGAFNKQAFSTFTGRATPTEPAASGKISASVEVYKSDFGVITAKPNRFMRPRDVLILQMDMWACAYLSGRKMVAFDLAKTGDSDAKEVLSEYTLVARNEASSGGIFDLTTT